MELRILSRIESGVLPEVEWNNEELKQEIAAKAKEYRSIAYTDAQAMEMKRDRATLNKLVTAFEDQRKIVKRFYEEPYKKFEARVKDVLVPVREAIAQIDGGLAEIDRQYRVDKKEKMRGFYDRYASEYGMTELVPFEKTLREELYKKAYTDKRLEQYYSDFFKRIECDMNALDELPERFREKAKLEYLKDFILSDAMREGKRQEELERILEERKRQQEIADAQRKTQEEKSQNAEPASVPQPDKACSENAVKQEQAAAKVVMLDFRVWGTKEQLMGLRQYMIDNQIKFGKVE